jgi:hypothetical protein
MSLRQRLAEHGFESNEDHDFALRCLFDAELAHLRCLHVDGHGGRRKTAFAHALGRALEYPHVLYHDFSNSEPASAPQPVQLEDDEPGPLEPGVGAFERAVLEACAFSEADRCMLILDQLQAADFAAQVQLYQFARTAEWTSAAGSVLANRRQLLLVLISEDRLYHSLAKVSFRIWTDNGRHGVDFQPADFGLGRDAVPLFMALGKLFEALDSSPTPSEFRSLLGDLLQRVRSEDQLRQSLFGWSEALEYERLLAGPVQPLLRAAVDAVNDYVGLDHIELTG